MKYTAVFTDSKGKKVTLVDYGKDKTIDSFVFKSNSIDDDQMVPDSRNKRCEFTLSGVINTENNYELGEIAKLSVKTSDVFVSLDVDVIDDDNDEKKIYRRLSFDKVFFVDYSEIYDDNKKEFVIKLAQAPLGKKQDIEIDLSEDNN